ncbi:MoaD/ThiS family protein [Arsenicicoccus dermatophilus]|uniref:MoaD/ThiS family protein n=1 Tax=Arsenicicoccus dermatophilus TaxID=1076331 RepID=UPI0039170D41
MVSAHTVEVRYWAGARAAAGAPSDTLTLAAGPRTVADVLAAAVEARPALAPVLPACSILLGGRAVALDAPVPSGGVVEVLPPFAGG